MKHLNFHHLYYFWAVAKEGHLTRAAQQLHVSQSALSSQIRQLEEQLGHRLFDRQGRSLQLTEVGYRVLEYAENIFNLGSEMLSLLAEGDGQRVQRLRIGAVATLSRNFQERFLQPVMGQADIKLSLQSAGLDELLAQLSIHKLDLILSNRPIVADAQTAWRCQRIAQQRVCLVGPNSENVPPFHFPDDLAGAKLILPGPSSDIRSQFDLYCDELGITIEEPYAEVDDMAMLRLLARDSGGLAVVPEIVVKDELNSGSLKKYAVLDDVVENFYAITASRYFKLPLVQDLLAQW